MRDMLHTVYFAITSQLIEYVKIIYRKNLRVSLVRTK